MSVEAGNCTPSDFELFAGPVVTLGRDPRNAIIVHDERASRRHAEVLYLKGHWIIRAVGNPRNGTHVNGEAISGPTPLEHGQEIGIGSTRLRFLLPALPEPPLDGRQPTVFQAGELSALCAFLAEAPRQTDPRMLIRCALETMIQQTGAAFAGFLSLDPDQPLPRLILPEHAPLDTPLSRQLTKEVQRTGRAMWLSGPRQDVASSESLEGFTDALCLPLSSDGPALGALHVYKKNDLFTPQHLRFAEALAGSLSASLALLRVRRSLEADNARLRGRAGRRPLARQQPRHAAAARADRPGGGPIGDGVDPRRERHRQGTGRPALHRQSPRRDGPLVVVNCAALAPTLLEAELFGHRKGAFTGADRDRPGLFEQADEGTLFLDEVGELSPGCQAKLLRVIEGKGFRPVGATADVTVDVRIIAATHRDLEAEVQKGDFRQDLLYRLQVIALAVPPLRDRAEDVPELAAHFLQRLAVECRRPVQLTDAALNRLQSYAWPGNVRQLWAILEIAVTMSDGPLLDERDLPLPSETSGAGPPTLNLDELETWAIRQALRQVKGQVSRAAVLLGLGRDTLAKKLKRKGIERNEE